MKTSLTGQCGGGGEGGGATGEVEWMISASELWVCVIVVGGRRRGRSSCTRTDDNLTSRRRQSRRERRRCTQTVPTEYLIERVLSVHLYVHACTPVYTTPMNGNERDVYRQFHSCSTGWPEQYVV